MSNRLVHQPIGAASGGALAAYHARGQPWWQQLLEVLGGLLGGWVGARLPDIIDPPTHPGHRAIGHALVPFTGASAAYGVAGPMLQARIRTEADVWAARRQSAQDPLAWLAALLIEAGLRIGAGAVPGVAGGHLSHLALDSLTPAGLPLLGVGGV